MGNDASKYTAPREGMKQIQRGNIIRSRTGAEYVIVSSDPKGFSLERASGKPVRITVKRLLKTLARLEAGTLAFQQNPSKGGISYTVAEEAGVVYALGSLVETDADARVFRLSGSN